MTFLRRGIALIAPALLVLAACFVSSADPAPAHAMGMPLPDPGVTALVSGSPSGMGDGASRQTSISDDGRFVAFTSQATNLTVYSTRDNQQVFVRDMSTGTTQIVSVSSSGSTGGNGHSHDPSISGDGRFIAFTSEATDLDATLPLTDDHSQIYIRDLTAGITRLVTRNTGGTAGGQYNSYTPSLSGDGTNLVFGSIAPDLLSGTTVGEGQIFSAKVVAGSMRVVGIVSSGDTGGPSSGAVGNDFSYAPSISHDGTAVAFTSNATNLTSDVLAPSVAQVFVHSMASGRTRLVSLAASGIGGGDAISEGPSISADGRRIAFTSAAANLAVNSPHPGTRQAYLRDMSQNATELLSVKTNGDASAGRSQEVSISGDGKRVAFSSNAHDLLDIDSRGVWQVYWRDVASRVTMLTSATGADPTRGGEDPYGSSPAYPFSAPRLSSDGQQIAFSAAANLLGAGRPGPAQVYLQGLRGPSVDRIGGPDRYAVSAAISAATFPPGIPVVFVASGAVFSDALSGSAAAGLQGAPVLLVGKDTVPDSIASELRRLHAGSVVVLGGVDTISARVETDLAAFGSPVSRIDGPDRFAVSAAISSSRFPKGTSTVYIASGEVFPDALSGSAAAGGVEAPVLLVTKTSIPASVSAELARLAPNTVVILGGESTISQAVYADLASTFPSVRRIGGSDRFEVSASISQDSFPNGQSAVYIASGAVFPDALSGSAAAIAGHSPVLLVTRDSIPASVITQLRRLTPYRIVVLGGPNTISDTVRDALDKYLARP